MTRGRRAGLVRVGGMMATLIGVLACGDDRVGIDPTPPPSFPPFAGTIFIDPDILTQADPTTYQGLVYAGRDTRTMYDRRSGWVRLEPFLFEASYDDELSIEVQVNPEFGTREAARVEAEFFAREVGRLPTALRRDVRTMWIHEGVQPFGGGNENILIHVGQADAYIADGILEETLVHEAVHTSLDARHAASAGWRQAQAADPTFISSYARDYPTREDLAETVVPWLAVEFRPGRISASMRSTILATIPNRIAFLNGLGLDMYPVEREP